MTDLRGYGDSSKPSDGDNHANYSKRAMALDHVEVMRALGHERFAVVGHDRGGRVAWRMCVEHPDRVSRAAILDIVPLPYSMVTREFATQYFHWFFLIQPAPFPETLIGNSASTTCDRAFSGRPAARCRHRRGVRRVPALLQGSGDDSRDVRGLSRRRVHRSRALQCGWREEGDVSAARAVGRTRDGRAPLRRDEGLARARDERHRQGASRGTLSARRSANETLAELMRFLA
jgi:pimeloyl-ACP methyl ester carboxylesterase